MSAASRTKLGFFSPGSGVGGPWRYLYSILDSLDPDEFDVTLFCDIAGIYERQPAFKVARLSEPVERATEPSATETHAAEPARRPSLGRFVPESIRLSVGAVRESRRLAALFRRHPVEIIHTQNAGCEESPVAAKLARIPRVLGTFHTDTTYDLQHTRGGPSYRALEMISNRCLDLGIAVSDATKADWVGRTFLDPDRVITIHNGIDANKFRRQRSRSDARQRFGLPDGLLIGAIGRLDEAKGLRYLIESVASLRQEFPDLTLVIAGTGPLRQELEAQAARLGIGASVRFLGFQSDVQAVLDALDVFALPSVCEALGYAFLEAMATELPAVGTAVGGIPEVILAGETGLLAPPRHSAALANSLRQLLQNAELRTRMGAAGRRRVEQHFREDDMVRKTIDVYRETSRKLRAAGRPA